MLHLTERVVGWSEARKPNNFDKIPKKHIITKKEQQLTTKITVRKFESYEIQRAFWTEASDRDPFRVYYLQ